MTVSAVERMTSYKHNNYHDYGLNIRPTYEEVIAGVLVFTLNGHK